MLEDEIVEKSQRLYIIRDVTNTLSDQNKLGNGKTRGIMVIQ